MGEALLSEAYRKYRVFRALIHRATHIYARDLVRALADDDGTLVVKLRSQYCAAAPALLDRSRERRTIFMIRHFESWARSVVQMFKVNTGYLVQEYRLSLVCYAYLNQHTTCHFLRYEDLAEQPQREMARLSEFLGRDIPAAAIDAAMAAGSQAGTRLGQVSEQGKARWEAIKDDANRAWTRSGLADFSNSVLQAGQSS